MGVAPMASHSLRPNAIPVMKGPTVGSSTDAAIALSISHGDALGNLDDV